MWRNDAMITGERHLGEKAWRGADVGEESSWRHPLPSESSDDLVRLARKLARGPRPTVETRLDDDRRAAWAGGFAPVREALEAGRGFAVVEAPADAGLSPEGLKALYWIVGQLLGEPAEQNVEGTLLYDVRDTGRTVSQGARFSVTNAESTFHTDASFADEVVDTIGLLCLNTAKSGGLSQLVSGHTAVAELEQSDPEAPGVLTRPFHVDRRGGVRPGEPPTVLRSVLERRGDDLLYNYLRTWIEAGHEKAGVPLSDGQVRALDALDRTLNRPELRVEFMLRPGDMFFSNNRWTLHNRTAFEDHPEPERRRHYVRLWLRKRPGHGDVPRGESRP